ncbi:uncharacterized protein BDR25DRAFT_304803 [Lindgomyces ingoldianus]|uniref:Uncharacterized protein n=1 Tax=Lindgomyces ingoldianus TaxID=673940 RepID=A0ACB6QPE5_9PLEO|nr:uncharacterized protein BDR25DRAFT_304803 [Lindgomyces ingoldianus]KAF2468843.1 hypothetical protein BDR25DRAFT_304803 [Lindgomyces ingoldianus]
MVFLPRSLHVGDSLASQRCTASSLEECSNEQHCLRASLSQDRPLLSPSPSPPIIQVPASDPAHFSDVAKDNMSLPGYRAHLNSACMKSNCFFHPLHIPAMSTKVVRQSPKHLGQNTAPFSQSSKTHVLRLEKKQFEKAEKEKPTIPLRFHFPSSPQGSSPAHRYWLLDQGCPRSSIFQLLVRARLPSFSQFSTNVSKRPESFFLRLPQQKKSKCKKARLPWRLELAPLENTRGKCRACRLSNSSVLELIDLTDRLLLRGLMSCSMPCRYGTLSAT